MLCAVVSPSCARKGNSAAAGCLMLARSRAIEVWAACQALPDTAAYSASGVLEIISSYIEAMDALQALAWPKPGIESPLTRARRVVAQAQWGEPDEAN